MMNKMYFTSSSFLVNILVSSQGFVCEKKLPNTFAQAKQDSAYNSEGTVEALS